MRYENIHWVDEDTYNKARFHLRAALLDVMSPFDELGHQVFIAGAIEEILQAADDYALVLRGVDKPIRVSRKRNSR